jgi:hypothetical protein
MAAAYLINNIYTKPVIFGHGPACRLSIFGPIVAISRLFFASVYSTICTKSVVIAYKISHKQPLYFGLPGVPATVECGCACVWGQSDRVNLFTPCAALNYAAMAEILKRNVYVFSPSDGAPVAGKLHGSSLFLISAL